MNLTFKAFDLPTDRERLILFLKSDGWPFHVNSSLSEHKILKMLEERLFDGTNHESFWILDGKTVAGFLRIYDLDDVDDGYPLFDLRISSQHRGRGLGKSAVSWLTQYLFKKHIKLEKIVGTTRADNLAMRKTFALCGYVKEGHYRNDWGAADGRHYDTVKYAVLREDWVSGARTPVRWNDQPSIDS